MGKTVALGAAMVCSGLLAVSARAENPVSGAFGETKPIIDVRLRYEAVDQLATPVLRKADAWTMRARLGFETGKAWNTALLVEGEVVAPLYQPHYREDNAVAVRTNYPVVADPEDQELNRFQLTNTSLLDTTITVGRQLINLDDQRFVGAAAWRMNEQTFDALRVVNRHISNLTVDMGWFVHVNRIYGPDSPQSPWGGDSYYGNVAYQTKIGKLTGFTYLLGFRPIRTIPTALDPARQATSTWGLRFAGERVTGPVKLAYIASYAKQQERGWNPLKNDNHYSLLELDVTWKQYTLGVGDEVLSGYLVPGTTTTVGFSTPLATLHKFQGWADKFLTTPGNGIDDRYATLTWTKKGVMSLDTLALAGAWHGYHAQRISGDYGSEWNVQLAGKFHRTTTTIKYASYRADATTPTTVARDTDKFWLQLDYLY
jgi:hypothetical protein